MGKNIDLISWDTSLSLEECQKRYGKVLQEKTINFKRRDVSDIAASTKMLKLMRQTEPYLQYVLRVLRMVSELEPQYLSNREVMSVIKLVSWANGMSSKSPALSKAILDAKNVFLVHVKVSPQVRSLLGLLHTVSDFSESSLNSMLDLIEALLDRLAQLLTNMRDVPTADDLFALDAACYIVCRMCIHHVPFMAAVADFARSRQAVRQPRFSCVLYMLAFCSHRDEDLFKAAGCAEGTAITKRLGGDKHISRLVMFNWSYVAQQQQPPAHTVDSMCTLLSAQRYTNYPWHLLQLLPHVGGPANSDLLRHLIATCTHPVDNPGLPVLDVNFAAALSLAEPNIKISLVLPQGPVSAVALVHHKTRQFLPWPAEVNPRAMSLAVRQELSPHGVPVACVTLRKSAWLYCPGRGTRRSWNGLVDSHLMSLLHAGWNATVCDLNTRTTPQHMIADMRKAAYWGIPNPGVDAA